MDCEKICRFALRLSECCDLNLVWFVICRRSWANGIPSPPAVSWESSVPDRLRWALRLARLLSGSRDCLLYRATYSRRGSLDTALRRRPRQSAPFPVFADQSAG